MPQALWSFNELGRLTKSEDPEVRFWAVDRLIRHFPAECCDTIAPFLLDDHEGTPVAVARHLGEHGAARHHAILARGFRLLRGPVPGLCLQSLARLGSSGVVEMAASALKRGDLNEIALAGICETLAGLGTPDSRELVREFVARKVELLAEPAGMRGMLGVVAAEEIPDVLGKFLKALQWRGSHRAGEAFRTLLDSLQIDDAGWCFRTGPSGTIELRKTIKAVESGYDCEIAAAMGQKTVNQIAQRIRAGDQRDTIRAIAEWTIAAAPRLPGEPGGEWPRRIAAAVEAFTREELLDEAARLGHQVQQWILGFQLSAAFAVARCENFELALKSARGDLGKLLQLAEHETAFLLKELPAAIAVVCRDDAELSRRAETWCLRMLEAQGPFFPKVVSLETLGELGSIHFVSEIMEYLSDENSYVYGAAEKALTKLGEAILAPAVARIESGDLDPDAAHSLLVLLCDLGTVAAYETVMARLDWFMEAVGPGTAAEWVSLFGTEELIDPLRDWLDEDPALVGQGVLLLASIHNVTVPEEDEILQAIEDARAREEADEVQDGGETPGGTEPEGGGYVM